ncbi:phytanoyl-CoA dioxygenase family protein [Candidatus Thioglobus sp.]|nr:phytanoyl-CoA dioxygenase family protein [Candidatus Thioglobus sp.]MDB9803091.1 phytanoyl-CoA dioxygenase family protein [Candidatus Thioglobus sp.]
MQKLTQQKVNEFKSQGYLVLEDFVSSGVLLELKESLNNIFKEIDKESIRVKQSYNNKHYGDISKAGRKFIKNQSSYYPAIQKYLKSKPIKEVVTKLLDGDAFIFNEQFVMKEPNTQSSFNWHQDSGYINFDHKPYLTTWLALDDTHSLNGPLSVIPTNIGTTAEVLTHQWSDKSKDLFIEVDEAKAKTLHVAAGALVVFSSLTPHASGSNQSSKTRTAYLAQYSSEPIIDPNTGLNRNQAIQI